MMTDSIYDGASDHRPAPLTRHVLAVIRLDCCSGYERASIQPADGQTDVPIDVVLLWRHRRRVRR